VLNNQIIIPNIGQTLVGRSILLLGDLFKLAQPNRLLLVIELSQILPNLSLLGSTLFNPF